MTKEDVGRYVWPEQPAREWADTEVKTVLSTRLMPEANQALAQSEQDIGRDVGNGTRELFVSCDATQAMQIQFDHIGPQYLVVDDMGSKLGRQLLSNMSNDSGWPVRQLVIRRQGFGTHLATLFYIDCPASNNRFVRLYASDVEADEATRTTLARLLLARSTMATILVPDAGPQETSAAFDRLRDEYFNGKWSNRHLIFMPIKARPEMVDLVAKFGRETGIAARITPSVQRASQIWVYLGASWNRTQETLFGQQAVTFTSLALNNSAGRSTQAAPAYAAPTNTAPRASSAKPASSAPPAFDGAQLMPSSGQSQDPPIMVYLRKLCQLPGVRSVCIFDVRTLAPIAHAGPNADPTTLAQQGRTLLTHMAQASQALGLGTSVNEAVITLAEQRIILRGIPGQPGWVLHLIVERHVMSVAQWLPELDKLANAMQA